MHEIPLGLGLGLGSVLGPWYLVHRAIVDPEQPSAFRLCVGG